MSNILLINWHRITGYLATALEQDCENRVGPYPESRLMKHWRQAEPLTVMKLMEQSSWTQTGIKCVFGFVIASNIVTLQERL